MHGARAISSATIGPSECTPPDEDDEGPMKNANAYTPVAAVAFLLVVAACAPFAAPSARPDAVSTAAPSRPGPTVTDSGQPSGSVRPSVASFGDRYLTLLEPLNDAACEFDTLMRSPGAGRVVLRAVTDDLADAIRAFMDATRKVEWPEETQDAIDDLVRGLEAHETALRAALDSMDDESFRANINAAQQARIETAPAALLVRTTLGLEGTRRTCTDP